jgi:hypothetical protein
MEDLERRVMFTEEKGRETRNRLDQIDDRVKEAGAKDKERRDAQVGVCGRGGGGGIEVSGCGYRGEWI